jgi:hypothetical protein
MDQAHLKDAHRSKLWGWQAGIWVGLNVTP